MLENSTQRFTDRVTNYIKYRPDYPAQVMEYLRKEAELPVGASIADIGSGTGIFTKQILDAGYTVFAVEPNEPMRAAADNALSHYSNYISVDGSSSLTTLKDHAVDLIVCAQAFHWFNHAETKKEFQRILTANGEVALIWNKRIVDADDFSKAYDQLLQQNGTDYNEVNQQYLNPEDFTAFFHDGKYEQANFPNLQLFDEEGLIGRAGSSSYVPALDTPEGKAFLTKLKEIFAHYQQNGKVSFQYHTEVYLGKV
ncbi:class I SAM-dependent methyltransferase [Pedobacter sp. L105]|uniref:class I SAM-dependent methyltransferase n=1 Tax=Pedobacter sp. L105 TaxID=1641871 RepID=UPI00131E5D6A|nr:class I SAM-dependent methyltransferase [Pedobacter sp. L105]